MCSSISPEDCWREALFRETEAFRCSILSKKNALIRKTHPEELLNLMHDTPGGAMQKCLAQALARPIAFLQTHSLFLLVNA